MAIPHLRRTLIVFLAAPLLALSLASVAAGEETAAESPGQKVFLAQKCNLCHAASAAGIEAKTKSEKLKGSDLSRLENQDPEWLAAFIKKEAERDGKNHKREFKGSDEELQALVDWLLEVQAEPSER